MLERLDTQRTKAAVTLVAAVLSFVVNVVWVPLHLQGHAHVGPLGDGAVSVALHDHGHGHDGHHDGHEHGRPEPQESGDDHEPHPASDHDAQEFAPDVSRCDVVYATEPVPGVLGLVVPAGPARLVPTSSQPPLATPPPRHGLAARPPPVTC